MEKLEREDEDEVVKVVDDGLLLYLTFDGFTPVNITPKQRANSPANDM